MATLDHEDYEFQADLQERLDVLDRTVRDYVEWRARCIRNGWISGIVVLSALALFIWWLV